MRAAAAVPVAIEWSTDGINWSTIQTEEATGASGEWAWFDISPVKTTAYIRVRATSGTLSVSQVYFGNTPSEVPLARINRDDYDSLPNKTMQSYRPVEYWFDRQIPQPIMHLWPVPNAAATVQQVVIRRHRHIMDVGTLVQEIEVPQRWYQAIVSLLALRLAYEIAEVDPGLIPVLEARSDKDLYIAQLEERDNSPFNLTPGVSVYTQ